MPARRIAAVIGCALWMASTATTVCAQSRANQTAEQTAAAQKADKILAEAGTHKGLLAQYLVLRQAYASDNAPAFRMIFGQYVGWYLSFLGDYPQAVRSFSIAQQAHPDDQPSPLNEGTFTARPAAEA